MKATSFVLLVSFVLLATLIKIPKSYAPTEEMFKEGGTTPAEIVRNASGNYQYLKIPVDNNADLKSINIDSSNNVYLVGNEDNGIVIYKMSTSGIEPASTRAVSLSNTSYNIDTDYGYGGRYFTKLGASTVTANDAAVDSQGRLIVVGEFRTSETASPLLFIARFKKGKAELDPTFASNGLLTEDFHGAESYPYTALAQVVLTDSESNIYVKGCLHYGSTSDPCYASSDNDNNPLFFAKFTEEGNLDWSSVPLSHVWWKGVDVRQIVVNGDYLYYAGNFGRGFLGSLQNGTLASTSECFIEECDFVSMANNDQHPNQPVIACRDESDRMKSWIGIIISFHSSSTIEVNSSYGSYYTVDVCNVEGKKSISNFVVADLSYDSQGRLVVVGSTSPDADADYDDIDGPMPGFMPAVVRFIRDGNTISRDSSFGTNGMVSKKLTDFTAKIEKPSPIPNKSVKAISHSYETTGLGIHHTKAVSGKGVVGVQTDTPIVGGVFQSGDVDSKDGGNSEKAWIIVPF